MKTVVYQSFRTQRIPAWIDACMASVRGWAAASGFDYEFIDDGLFERVPAWFRESAKGEICPQADLARLVLAKEFFDAGYDRTVWVDADVLVFAPEALRVDDVDSFAYCREVWLGRNPKGEYIGSRRVNNSITVFARANVHLDFFIDACLRVAAREGGVTKLSVSTRFLTDLSKVLPMRLLMNVGTFSPLVLEALAHDPEGGVLRAYAGLLAQPLACANLCASLQDKQTFGALATADVFAKAVETCLATRGGVVNRYVKPRP